MQKQKTTLLICLVGLILGCTKAPEPVPMPLFEPLPSTIMPPMSGYGIYAEQISIWRDYTSSFYEFSLLHNTLGSVLRQNVGIATMQTIVENKFMKAYYSLYALDELFTESIQLMTNNIPPAAFLDKIVPVDFSIYGAPMNVLYVNSWYKFRSQISKIANKANTETEAGRELKAAAEDLISKVESCISIMNTVL